MSLSCSVSRSTLVSWGMFRRSADYDTPAKGGQEPFTLPHQGERTRSSQPKLERAPICANRVGSFWFVFCQPNLPHSLHLLNSNHINLLLTRFVFLFDSPSHVSHLPCSWVFRLSQRQRAGLNISRPAGAVTKVANVWIAKRDVC